MPRSLIPLPTFLCLFSCLQLCRFEKLEGQAPILELSERHGNTFISGIELLRNE